LGQRIIIRERKADAGREVIREERSGVSDAYDARHLAGENLNERVYERCAESWRGLCTYALGPEPLQSNLLDEERSVSAS
jgi:hypothetical protein